jgi:hypothetical protein
MLAKRSTAAKRNPELHSPRPAVCAKWIDDEFRSVENYQTMMDAYFQRIAAYCQSRCSSLAFKGTAVKGTYSFVVA